MVLRYSLGFLTYGMIFVILLTVNIKTFLMKKITYSRLIVCSICVLLGSFLSCEKDDSMSPEDRLIKNQLIGTWTFTNTNFGSITFYDDNTFIDSTYSIFGDKPLEFQINEVLKGQYLVNNGQLKYSNVKLIYVKGGQSNSTLQRSISTYEPLNTVSFEGSNLVIKPLVLLVPSGKSNSNIIGKWSSDKVVGVYDKTLNNQYTGGTMTYNYEFKSDLSLVVNTNTVYDNIKSSDSQNLTYVFNSPTLNIKEWGYYFTVSFEGNQMFWTYGSKTYKKNQ
jgi:hypothetical protein